MIEIIKEELSNTYKPGDILFLTKTAFKKYPGNEVVQTNHPFVVLDNKTVAEISSRQEKTQKYICSNIEIEQWKEAGLLKPSHIKVDEFGEIDDSCVFKKIGELSQRDLRKAQLFHEKFGKHSRNRVVFEWTYNLN